ncbi:MAG: hypothetical protein WCX61_02835 [Candidatus Peribacteraceae bacterium]|jgi:thymidine kinase
MPRGKRVVFAVSCPTCKARVGTLRLHRQDKKGVGYKDHVAKIKKYCSHCRKEANVKVKEEKHSS